MSKLRSIELLYAINQTHWVGDGFKVRNYFPSGRNLLTRFSPFILLDYGAPNRIEATQDPKGVGPHPHRGFETVTFAFEGAVEHHDNQGNHGIIYPGDVQWMTAGSGVMHKEYLEKGFARQGGIIHMVQLWVNLPKVHKWASPAYQAITREDMGNVTGEGYSVSITAGEFQGVKGPAHTFTPMNLYTVKLQAGYALELNEPAHYHTGFLVVEGNLHVNGQQANAKDFVLLADEDGIIQLKAISTCQILVLSGEPIDEPIAAGGPFVMNTRSELIQANEDFYSGKFGTFDF